MMRRKRLVVGLVGAVASGKSTVARLFRKFGAVTADADRIAHAVLDRPAVRRAVARAFGPAILAGGRLDRRALGQRVFRSPPDLRRLNAILHPHVRRDLLRRMRSARGVFVIDAPLLQETGADAWCDVVVYVDVPRRVREARAVARGWPPGEIRRRERFQWSPVRKRAGADCIIRNGGSVVETERQVRRIYRTLAKSTQGERGR